MTEEDLNRERTEFAWNELKVEERTERFLAIIKGKGDLDEWYAGFYAGARYALDYDWFEVSLNKRSSQYRAGYEYGMEARNIVKVRDKIEEQ